MRHPERGPRPKARQAKPVAPFDKDIGKASANAFDRETGAPVSSTAIRTYREALAQYHLSPESKFHNGDFLDRGRTERRHIKATTSFTSAKKRTNGRSSSISA